MMAGHTPIDKHQGDEHYVNSLPPSKRKCFKYVPWGPTQKYLVGGVMAIFLALIVFDIPSSESSSNCSESPQALDTPIEHHDDNSHPGEAPEIPQKHHHDHTFNSEVWNDIPEGKNPDDWNPTIIDLEYTLEHLDTDPENSRIFLKNEIQQDVIYMEKTNIHTSDNITLSGRFELLESEYDHDSLLEIKEYRTHTDIHYMVTRLALESETEENGIVVHYHYNSEEGDYDDDSYTGLTDVVGTKVNMRIRPDGTVTFLDEKEEIVEEIEFLQDIESMAPSVSAEHQYDSMIIYSQTIPKHKKLKPGDKNRINISIGGLDYEGDNTLMGYTMYEGVECAVFENFGHVRLEHFSELEEESLENEFNGTAVDIDGMLVKHGHFQHNFIWDIEDHYPRYSSESLEFLYVVDHPFKEGEKVLVPSSETSVRYMSL